MRCLGCGYTINDIARQQCPECGRVFDARDPRTFEREPWGSQRLHDAMARVMMMCWVCAAIGGGASVLRIAVGVIRAAHAQPGEAWRFYIGISTLAAALGLGASALMITGASEHLSRLNAWPRYRKPLVVMGAIWVVFLVMLVLV